LPMRKGFRMTRQRQIIIEELRKMHSHPTADEVYDRVRKRLPRVSLGTVYRNLETLSQSAVIQKLELAGPRRRFDGSLSDHYHVACVNCGKVEDVCVEPSRALEDSARLVSSYEILGHSVKFLGMCPICSKQHPNLNSRTQLSGSTGP